MSDSTREALNEIGDRARGIVEELARKSRERASQGPPAPPPAAQAPLPEIHHRLNELRACVGEVADVLEATVERLETVEFQLGDPDASIERQLADGIERCERVLLGIEYRVARTGEQGSPGKGERPPDAPTVLVVARSSCRRARLCLALERQGLPTLAATDLELAVKRSARSRPSAVLVDAGDAGLSSFDEWKEHVEQGTLPRVVVLEAAGQAGGGASGFEVIKEEHGEAAMAASLLRIARAR